MSVSIYELKTQLSKYIALLEEGKEEEIEITKNGKVVASILPKRPKRDIFNVGKELYGDIKIQIKGDMYDDVVNSFYGD
ncbi:MAG: type II toxin-antitoxin system prevent-host-death family antitoxin [Erysipelotrichaceae bacterium]|jgi:antitoxin (DNA-binding transcriptional repressor) of toxin-antitoxin stability system|nr:type II toxin-antitoxin system prevent-host-death family antitoxin [Erysipelotrichaceae bacterium]